MMLTRAPPFAESGHASGSVFGYAGWVPAGLVVGMLGGLAVGFAYALLAAISEGWRVPYESRSSPLAKFGPRTVCGAIAGLTVGLLTGPGAIGVAVAGAITALVLAVRDERAPSRSSP